MGNALWLILALPSWFFATFFAPLGAGPLTLIPFIGIFCLGAGLALGVQWKQRRYGWFVVSFLLSEVFVAIAGLLRGYRKGGAATPYLLLFLGLQGAICAFLVYRFRGARLGALCLAMFCVIYALFTSFVARMAFGDDWL
jgi:hypothetical protein